MSSGAGRARFAADNRPGALVALTLAAALAASGAVAQTAGRLEVTVKNAAGEPVADVAITITSPDRGNVKLEKKTNKKGRALVSVVDTSLAYDFLFEHPDFAPLSERLAFKYGEVAREEIVLQPAATAVAREAAGSGSDRALELYNQGAAAFAAGDDSQAAALFGQALELDPGLAAAIKGLAVIAAKQERWQEAAELSERYLALDPAGATVLRIRYDAYRSLGDQAKEKTALEALSAIDSGPAADRHFDRGVELFDAGDLETAAVEFEEVLKLDPERARAHYRLGLCYVNSGDNAKAREHLQTFVELAPDDSEAAAAREMISFLE